MLPTLSEIGYRGPVTRSYFAFYAPAGTPKEMLDKIAADVRAIGAEPSFREKNFIQRGIEPVLNTPDEFAAFLKEDRARAKRVVDQSAMKMQ